MLKFWFEIIYFLGYEQDGEIKLKKWYHKRSFVFLFLSFLVLTTVTLLLVSVTIYEKYKRDTIRENIEISEQMLSQTVYGSDFIWDWATAFAFSLYKDGDIYNAIMGNNIQKKEEFTAERKMMGAVTANPLIHSIYLYNNSMNQIYSSVSTPYNVENFFDKNVLNILDNNALIKELQFIPRRIQYKIYDKEYSDNILSIILSEKLMTDDPIQGALILNVNERYIQSLIQSINPNKDDLFIIIDKTGRVVSHSDYQMFFKDLSYEKYIDKVINSSSVSGCFVDEVNGERSLVTYMNSAKLKWNFIRITPYKKIFTKVYGMRNLIIIFSIILFVIILILSGWVSWKFYSPINTLVQKVDQEIGGLQKENQVHRGNDIEYISQAYLKIIENFKSLKEKSLKNRIYIRRELLRNLLTSSQIYYKDIENKLKELEINIKPVDMMVYLLRIDNFYNYYCKTYDTESQELFRYAVANIAQELTSKYYTNETIDMGGDTIAVILNVLQEDINNTQERVIKCIKDIQEAVKEHLNFTVSGAISCKVDNILELSEAYRYVVEISDYRLIFRKETIITPEMAAPNINNKEYSYSEETEKEILDNIRLRKYSNVEEKVNEFFEMLNFLSYSDILMSISRLVYSSVKMINGILGSKDYSMSFKFLQSQFEYLDTLDEIKIWLLNIYQNAIEGMYSEHANVKKNHVDKVLKIIETEYGNSNLSSEELAKQIGLSTTYLREVFKELQGIFLSDYINQYRCEKAKELLLQTQFTVLEICEKIGIVNNNYFYTLFKRYTGLTPTQYRKKNQG